MCGFTAGGVGGFFKGSALTLHENFSEKFHIANVFVGRAACPRLFSRNMGKGRGKPLPYSKLYVICLHCFLQDFDIGSFVKNLL